MPYDTDLHRRSIRLRHYDYTQPGAYFVTVCTQDRQCLFGEVVDGVMQLNRLGEIIQAEWLRSAIVRPNVKLDSFVVMPNHVHGIIILTDDAGLVGATRRVAPTVKDTVAPTGRACGPGSGSVGAIIGQYKSMTTKRINERRGTPGAPIWQRNYYEHIIRSEDDMNRAILYITENPARWAEDDENPVNATGT